VKAVRVKGLIGGDIEGTDKRNSCRAAFLDARISRNRKRRLGRQEHNNHSPHFLSSLAKLTAKHYHFAGWAQRVAPMGSKNDGLGMGPEFYGRQAGQDQKHFPLGTSTAKAGLTEAIRKENERFRSNLARVLGSEAAADAYIKNRPYNKPMMGYWNAKRP
jgi:hypothetical protein